MTLKHTTMKRTTTVGLCRLLVAPPSHGKLATLDPALLVTSPAGLEVGYVPIVTRQARQ